MRRFVLVVMVAGCGDDRHPPLSPDGQPLVLTEVAILPALANPDLDLLVVVDDSPAMAPKQASLRASFASMIDTLATLDGGLPDLHIGVVTTDMGASSFDGMIGPSLGGHAQGACSNVGRGGALVTNPAVSGTFIEGLTDSAAITTSFAALSNVGDFGCGFEQPLSAVYNALRPDLAANAGFVRPDANLGIVILSDEDDCSLSDPGLLVEETSVLGPLQSFRCTHFGVLCDDGGATTNDMAVTGAKSGCHINATSNFLADGRAFVDQLQQMKSDPAQVMVAAIVGDLTPVVVTLNTPEGEQTAIASLMHSCTFADEVADPAVRTAQFAAQFSARNAVTSICDTDLSSSLTKVGLAEKQLMGDPCLLVALAHPDHPNCEVIDGGVTLPSCDASTGDCWRIVTDPMRCAASPDQLRVEIVRSIPPAQQRFAHVSCETS